MGLTYLLGGLFAALLPWIPSDEPSKAYCSGLKEGCCRSEELPNNCQCFHIAHCSFLIGTSFATPGCPDDVGVTFKLYTRANRLHGTRLRAGRSFPAAFDGSKPIKFLTHGYLGSISSVELEIKDAILKREDVNFITVDWSRGASYGFPYHEPAANTRTVGAMITRLILDMKNDYGVSMNSIHLIGHSLGAHVMGFAGKEIKHWTGRRVSRITGLDPAGPFFQYCNNWARLDRTDAQFVDIIHTNAAPLYLGGLGIRSSLGDVDFWVNGGKYQPGCAGFDPTGITVIVLGKTCSHSLAVEFFLSSIKGCTWGYSTCTMGYNVSRKCKGNYYPTARHQWPSC